MPASRLMSCTIVRVFILYGHTDCACACTLTYNNSTHGLKRNEALLTRRERNLWDNTHQPKHITPSRFFDSFALSAFLCSLVLFISLSLSCSFSSLRSLFTVAFSFSFHSLSSLFIHSFFSHSLLALALPPVCYTSSAFNCPACLAFLWNTPAASLRMHHWSLISFSAACLCAVVVIHAGQVLASQVGLFVYQLLELIAFQRYSPCASKYCNILLLSDYL